MDLKGIFVAVMAWSSIACGSQDAATVTPAAIGSAGASAARTAAGSPAPLTPFTAAAMAPSSVALPPSAAASSAPAASTTSSSSMTAAPPVNAVSSGPSGIVEDPSTGELVFRTAAIDLPAGKESYVCYAATLDQDAAIDGFSKGTQGFVHHIQFAEVLWPEPEGLSQCDVLFKLTWMPIFLAGAGASELRLDEGVGHSLPAGTQLVAQLHLLNASDHDIHQQVEIRMHRSASPNPRPISPWAIGSSEINLTPKQPGQAQNVCTMTGPVDLVAVFPHMHMLGKQLKVEVGKSLDTLKPLYARDPYDFDDQHMEKVKISLQTGDVLRVTCNYMNDTDQVAKFGESTHDEMCFFVGFAVGDSPGAADCPNLWDKLFEL